MYRRAALLTAIVALGFPAEEARAVPTDKQWIGVLASDAVPASGRSANSSDKTAAVGTLVLATGLNLNGSRRANATAAAATTDITARPQPIPTGATRKVHGDANPVLNYVLGDIGLVAGEARPLLPGRVSSAKKGNRAGALAATSASAGHDLAFVMPPFAEAIKCSTSAALSMSAAKNMRLVDFMKTVASKAGMRVIDKGIGNMRITVEAFSAIALHDVLRETSGKGQFLADIKGCNLVLSPVLPAKAVANAPSATRQQPARHQETDLANLVLAIAEKSGRSVTMIGDPVPLKARLDGASDMDPQALASAINHAAAGVLRVTVRAETIVLQYLAAGAAATTGAQEQFREQGQFLVLPTLDLTQKAVKKPSAKDNDI